MLAAVSAEVDEGVPGALLEAGVEGEAGDGAAGLQVGDHVELLVGAEGDAVGVVDGGGGDLRLHPLGGDPVDVAALGVGHGRGATLIGVVE